MSDSEDFCSSSDDENNEIIIDDANHENSNSEDEDEEMAELRSIMANNASDVSFYDDSDCNLDEREKKEKKKKEKKKEKHNNQLKNSKVEEIDISKVNYNKGKYVLKNKKISNKPKSRFMPLGPPLEYVQRNNQSSRVIHINDSPEEFPLMKKK
jgi:hypothetical protein